jgi:hypothetical protein
MWIFLAVYLRKIAGTMDVTDKRGAFRLYQVLQGDRIIEQSSPTTFAVYLPFICATCVPPLVSNLSLLQFFHLFSPFFCFGGLNSCCERFSCL